MTVHALSVRKPKRPTRVKRAISRLCANGNALRPYMHRDDRKAQIVSLEWAKKVGPKFVREHADELAALVLVYADASAEEMLEVLREHFWSGEWERLARQRKPVHRVGGAGEEKSNG